MTLYETFEKWGCDKCEWVGEVRETLRAPSPFDALDVVVGCPQCQAVNTISKRCDAVGCMQFASCGTPIPGQYVFTCHDHRPKEKV